MATFVVTGANRGIGLALTRQLAARGDTVLAVVREAGDDLRGLAGVEVFAGIDVGADDAIAKVQAALGDRAVDVLVNNAGILRFDTLDDVNFADLRASYEVNTLGPLRMVLALRKNLGRGAKVAIVTSRVGSIADNGSGRMYGYRASKAAVNMIGANLAIELRPAGVAVVLLHPGMVHTEMTGHGIPPEESARGLVARIDELTLETTGRFVHQNGEALPW